MKQVINCYEDDDCEIIINLYDLGGLVVDSQKIIIADKKLILLDE